MSSASLEHPASHPRLATIYLEFKLVLSLAADQHVIDNHLNASHAQCVAILSGGFDPPASRLVLRMEYRRK